MPKVFVEKCESYNPLETERAVRKVLSNIDLKSSVSDKKILLVPNLLFGAEPEMCITTHPSILEAVIKVLKDYNAKILVGDSPFSDDPFEAYIIAGFKDVCERQDVKFVDFGSGKYYNFENGKHLKGIRITAFLDEVDMVINIPKVKCHQQMYFTGAMKGIFSLVTTYRRGLLHLRSGSDSVLGEAILDIFNFVKPKLSIFDGVYGLEGNGPGSGGEPKFAGFISCSQDAIALDYATMKLVGLNPNKASLMKAAKRRGQLDENSVEILGDVSSIKVKFKEPDMVSVDRMPKFLNKFREKLADLDEVVIV